MSDRLSDWVDTDNIEKDAELEVLYDQVVSVDVFRASGNTAETGLTTEVNNASIYDTFNVRLDPPDQPTDAYLGLIDSKDVRINDKWRFTAPNGRVQFLLVRSAEFRTSTTQVRLTYA